MIRLFHAGWGPMACLAAIFPAALAAAEPTATIREELFQRVFGHPQPSFPVESQVIVVVDHGERISLRGEVTPDGKAVRVHGPALMALLARLLRPELLRELALDPDAQGYVDSTALNRIGMVAAFDPRTFEYHLTTAPSMRAVRRLEVTPSLPDPLLEDALRPSDVSGFMNFNIKASDGDHTARQARSLGVAVDGALNLTGLVLEGSAFGDGGKHSWRRGELRAVYDLPGRAQRFIAGDLILPDPGFQRAVAAGGIGFSKDYSLQPQKLTYATGGLTFALDRPAAVKILRDGTLLSTLQLDAGVHELQRFTPAAGLNEFDIVVEDAAGRRETMHYSFVHDPALLDGGLSRYAWNAGFARQLQGNRFVYATDQPVLSGMYQRGLSPAITLGSHFQFTRHQALAGTQLLRALPAGTLLVDAAVSRDRDRELHGAVRLALARTGVHGRPEARLSVAYRDAGFDTNPGSRRPGGQLDAQASLGLPLPQGLGGRLSARFATASARGGRTTFGAAASLHKTLGRITASLTLRHDRLPGTNTDTAVLFGMQAHLAHRTGSYGAARDPGSGQLSAQWNSPRRGTLSTPFGFASWRDGARRELEAGGGYVGNQGLLEATYQRTGHPDARGSGHKEEASLRFEGALAFAAGRFALSRSIRENFVIVSGRQGLRGAAMRVEPDSRGRSLARSSWLGPAVVNDLASYRVRTLRIEPVDAPFGAVPAKLNFRLAPGYKSGLLLPLGEASRMIGVGRLVDSAGAPLVHRRIEIQRSDLADEAPLQAFTGNDGRFQTPGLVPGLYWLRLAGEGWMRAAVRITSTADGMFRLGDVVLKPE